MTFHDRVKQMLCWRFIIPVLRKITFSNNIMQYPLMGINSGLYHGLSRCYSRALVVQSVATQAVNPGVVSSNPSSFRRLRNVTAFHQWANSLCGKAASCLESMLCGVLVWKSQEELATAIWLCLFICTFVPWFDPESIHQYKLITC